MEFRLRHPALKAAAAALAFLCIAGCAIYAILVWTNRSASLPSKDAAAAPPMTVSAPQQHELHDKRSQPASLSTNSFPARIPRVLDTFPQDVVVNYAELAKAARNGDVDAAKRIYGVLMRCKNVPESKAEVDGLIEQERLHPSSDTSVADSSSFLARQWADCSQLSHEQRASTSYWLALAARSGDSEAKLDYVLSGQPASDVQDADYWKSLDDYRTTARTYLDEEISAGSVRALSIAASNYAQGGIYDVNPSKRYAYLYAYVLASGETGGSEMRALERLRDELGPTQTQGAVIDGENIAKRCCIH